MWKWSDSRSGIRSSSIPPSSWDLHLLGWLWYLTQGIVNYSFTYVVSNLILTNQDLPVDTGPEERFV